MRRTLTLVADLAAVVVFAGIGRASHRETAALVGLAGTAWPFLVGTLVGTLVLVIRGRATDRATDPAGLVAGVVVWLATAVLGLALRAVSGGGMAPSFVVVATISLAVLLLGWRAGYAFTRRIRARTPVAQD